VNSNSVNTSEAIAGEIPSRAGEKDEAPQSLAWIWVCLFLLTVTWAPVFGIHVYRTALDAASTGTVVVVFPPTVNTRDLFRNISDADGSIVRPVSWFPKMWVARSLEPGFAGRLKERGAWGVYSTDFLKASALLSCIRIVASPNSSRPANQELLPPAT
jgi:hypothetical protein